MNHTDWASRWNLYKPDSTAIFDFDSALKYSFSELHQLGSALAKGLCDKYGLKKGDRIAVLAENRAEHILLFIAAQKAGFILAPLNFRLTPAELEYQLTDCQPRVILVESTLIEKAEKLKNLESIEFKLDFDQLHELIDAFQGVPFNALQLKADDPIFILYTSGTTGFPKGAIYTHGMLFWNSVNTSISLNIGTESRTINCMPFFHTGGWNVLTTPFLHQGGYTTLIRRFDAEKVLKLLESEQATIFMGVPTMLQMIADEPFFEQADLSALEYIIVGGEPMPIPLIERWHTRGIAIRQGYGMTEVGPNLTSLHQDDATRKKGSIGRPNFYVEIKIVDENGIEVSVNSPGELLLRGPMVSPGYWGNPEASRQAIKAGWFHTGDLVVQDEEGYLFVVDRIKNMYISGGENVYPAEIERVLLQIPEIAEAVVVGVPDPKWGEAGKAFIVTHDKKDIPPNIIQSFCKKYLANFKIPKHIQFLDELPKNDTGKLNRRMLKE